MFQLLGFIVNLEPLHAENLGEHAFDQMVTFQQPFGNQATRLSQGDPPLAANPDQAIPLQALDCGGNSRRGDQKPPGECGGNDDFAL